MRQSFGLKIGCSALWSGFLRSRETVRSAEPTILLGVFFFALAVSTFGCASPSAANNKLRVENQKLEDRIAGLEQDKAHDRAEIGALEKNAGTIPTLPQERLGKLFLVGGLKLGRLTGAAEWNPQKPEENGMKVEAVPLDEHGEKIKAAGSFVIDAFDLANGESPKLGHWEVGVDEAKKQWYGSAMLYAYILKCPWEKPPSHEEVTLKVTFRDELTGREFTQQQVVKVKLPPKGQ
jgi:hypothetical protein